MGSVLRRAGDLWKYILCKLGLKGEERVTNPGRCGRVFAFSGFDFSKTAKIAKQYRQMSLA
jgi:hypothetical protein